MDEPPTLFLPRPPSDATRDVSQAQTKRNKNLPLRQRTLIGNWYTIALIVISVVLLLTLAIAIVALAVRTNKDDDDNGVIPEPPLPQPVSCMTTRADGLAFTGPDQLLINTWRDFLISTEDWETVAGVGGQIVGFHTNLAGTYAVDVQLQMFAVDEDAEVVVRILLDNEPWFVTLAEVQANVERFITISTLINLEPPSMVQVEIETPTTAELSMEEASIRMILCVASIFAER